MNPGTFQGAGTGALGGSITRYTQTPTITTSQTIPVPNGVQRIEALLIGGGGSGGYYNFNTAAGGGGFGGGAIIEIPVTGQPLQVVIGAGGAAVTGGAPGNNGSPTYVVSAGTRYAEVGGGGGGGSGASGAADAAKGGRSGGGGGGGGYEWYMGAPGGQAPIGNVLWSIYPQTNLDSARPDQSLAVSANTVAPWVTLNSATSGQGAFGLYVNGTWKAVSGGSGSLGGGGGGGHGAYGSNGLSASDGGYGGGGGGGFNGAAPGNGTWGGGGGNGRSTQVGGTGGSLASVSIWGYTGFAGATPTGIGGGGGGGMLSAGTNSGGNNGGNGGNGGGGGGGAGWVSSLTSGAGGNGMAVIRFYF